MTAIDDVVVIHAVHMCEYTRRSVIVGDLVDAGYTARAARRAIDALFVRGLLNVHDDDVFVTDAGNMLFRSASP